MDSGNLSNCWYDYGFAPWTEGVRTGEEIWREPLRWNDAPGYCVTCGRFVCPGGCDHGIDHFSMGRRPRVFCAVDWLDEVPVELLADLLALIKATPNLDWVLPTNCPENWEARMRSVAVLLQSRGSWTNNPVWRMLDDWLPWNGRVNAIVAPPNIWIGTPVENQKQADQRIPHLLKIAARVRFLICELLGPVDLNAVKYMQGTALTVGDEAGWEYTGSPRNMISWVICGGEIGGCARPMRPDWVRSLRDQCVEAAVPFFFAGWGEWAPWQEDRCGKYDLHSFCPDSCGDSAMQRVGPAIAGRLLDGVEHNDFPV